MPDLREILKLFLILAAVPGIPAVLYLGFRWARAGIQMLEVENEQKAGAGTELSAEVDALRARVAESEDLKVRIAEVEERLDFAERLLAQQQEPRQVER